LRPLKDLGVLLQGPKLIETESVRQITQMYGEVPLAWNGFEKLFVFRVLDTPKNHYTLTVWFTVPPETSEKDISEILLCKKDADVRICALAAVMLDNGTVGTDGKR
jgi:hypothetical protein